MLDHADDMPAIFEEKSRSCVVARLSKQIQELGQVDIIKYISSSWSNEPFC